MCSGVHNQIEKRVQRFSSSNKSIYSSRDVHVLNQPHLHLQSNKSYGAEQSREFIQEI